jgi:hypothetical protein
MHYFILAFLFSTRTVLSSSLLIEDPEPGHWYEIRSFGVGGVVEVDMEVIQSPELRLEMKLGSSQGEDLLKLVSDQEMTKIYSPLSEERVESSSLLLIGVERVKVVVELQGEGVFVDLVGVGSVLLPYPPGSWSGNKNSAWDTLDTLSRVYIDGRGVKFTRLSGHVLVF